MASRPALEPAMTTFVELAATKPVIFVHAVSMIGAVALGGWLLVSRKGRTAHRVGGVGPGWR
jgi:uncharacterized membrane protein